ncbi:MAG: hypothetical protein H7335_00810 [Massilia sp.]|nr:hypothetical protein [Massilia sp.]
MTRRTPFAALLLLALALAAHGALVAAPKKDSERHRFGVIGHSFHNGSSGEAKLKQAIADESEAALAFVVVTGIKGGDEPCSDSLYEKRRALFDDARRPMIVALSASDWSACKNSAGRSVAIDRLNRLRELFFNEPSSLGVHQLPLTRLSASAKFRSYAENAHWQIGDVLYATINLPANNNHYRAEAGRNSEFEDRLVANRFWLNRLFAMARREKLGALVLFSEGDVKALAQPSGLRALLGRSNSFDGFDEPRRQIATLAQKYAGKVLLIDTDAARKSAGPVIEWRGNLGHVSVGSEAVEVQVTPGASPPFTLKNAADEK